MNSFVSRYKFYDFKTLTRILTSELKAMEPKKISFGFSKLTKTSNIIPQKSTITSVANKKELIDCLEDQNIKVKE